MAGLFALVFLLLHSRVICRRVCNGEMIDMTTLAARRPANPQWVRSMFGGFMEGMSLVSAAHECAMATRERRHPSIAALQTLGIDEVAFGRTLKRR